MGEYNPEKVKGHKSAASTGCARKELFRGNPSPGPGAYTNTGPPVADPKCPAFPKSMNHKGPSVVSEGPGPGEYTPLKEEKARTPAKDFGLSHISVTSMHSFPDEGPGPGEYPNAEKFKDAKFPTKSAGMGVERKQLFAVPANPGPAAYDTRGDVVARKPASAIPSFGSQTVNHVGPTVTSGPEQPG